MTSATRPPRPQEVVQEQNAVCNSCRGGPYLHFDVLTVAIALTVMELQLDQLFLARSPTGGPVEDVLHISINCNCFAAAATAILFM